MLHESGTGGAPTYGLIPQMPLTTLEGVNFLDNITYMQPRTSPDEASVGYYKTQLQNRVKAEMSASMHAGIMRYSFPQNADGRHILVDLSHFIPSAGKKEQWYSNGELEINGDGTSYSGYGVYREGWGWGGDYRVYFCGKFDTRPAEARLFSGKATDPYWPNATDVRPTFTNATSIRGGTVGYQYADRIGALFSFPPNSSVLASKVGISWVSEDKACQFLEEEIPHWDLEKVQQAAKDRWNIEVLSKIDVQTNNKTQSEMFYTAMYHSHLMPSDRTGENPYWESEEPYYDDFYTLWDTFRTLHPLLTLIEPERQSDIVRAMIDIWRHERFMPEGRSHNHNGRVQGGSNSDNVLADAYVKGLKGINWADGYAAMKTNAEIQPYNNFDFEDPSGSTKEGRGGLQDWKEYGYVTPDRGRCLSKTVDYALNDFSLSQVARGQAPEDVAVYLNRSAGWQKTWSHNTTSLNFTGFLAPTYGNGSIKEYDPLSCGACDWQSISYEGVPWEYTWSLPHDMETVITLMGGPDMAEKRLDTMFIPGLTQSNQGGNSAGTTIFNPGNEPSFMTPFLYNYWPQRQHKSVKLSRDLVDQYYNNGRSGIPGNDDAGAMSSWLVWNMIGLYPVATQPVYLILAPRFGNITMTLGNSGAVLRIKANQLESGPYVQHLKVNGKNWTKSWINHEDIVRADGRDSTLEFRMGVGPVPWDSGEVPPSPGHVTI
ncbi:hypothetical protein SLS60_008363 [Paraconiothyrium brasiliense]|uniref:Alpha-1,2-mannosidase n=1 Tax=Paraconiothyrium brasiliense TaxID=300254 RepID=A0ABR3R0D1_9PLEO